MRDATLSDARIRGIVRVRNGVDWGWFPDPWQFVRCGWEPSARRLLIFEENTANKTMPTDTVKIVADSLTCADDANGEPYFHDQIVFCDDTAENKVQMDVGSTSSGSVCTRPGRPG